MKKPVCSHGEMQSRGVRMRDGASEVDGKELKQSCRETKRRRRNKEMADRKRKKTEKKGGRGKKEESKRRRAESNPRV